VIAPALAGGISPTGGSPGPLPRLREALAQARARLALAGCDTPRLDAELLAAHALRVDRAALLSRPDQPVDPGALERLERLVGRREDRQPVAYILGTKGFRHLELAVDPRGLIPRPETELLVDAALDLPTATRVIDVGTGSGAVALALKHERPDLAVTGADMSAAVLELARANARRLGLDVDFLPADLLPAKGAFDAVVANLPYVADADWPGLAPEIVRHEPREALVGGRDGLESIRRLVDRLGGVSFAALEVGEGQAGAVRELLRRARFASVTTRLDLAGIERVVVARRR
jgi:release factor glutamine methyltransferase